MKYAATIFLLALSAPPSAAMPHRSAAPDLTALLSTQQLDALTQSGEVLLLPKRNAAPFTAAIAAQTQASCRSLANEMMHPERWPKRFKRVRDDVEVTSRTKTMVRYEFRVAVPFSPTIEGVVRKVSPALVLFGDAKEGVTRIELTPTAKGCRLIYRVSRTPGFEPNFVSVVRKVEDGSGDAVELASALATVRGWAPPSVSKGLDNDGKLALQALARRGTAVHISNTGKAWEVVGNRAVKGSVSTVVHRLGQRLAYARKTDFFRSVEPEAKATQWHFGYFGGRVNFETRSTQRRSGDVFHLRESVSDGDLEKGSWVWTVQPTQGGSNVELNLDLDIIQGSRILRMIVGKDETLRESAKLQLLLGLLVDVVGLDALRQPVVPAPRLTSELSPLHPNAIAE